MANTTTTLISHGDLYQITNGQAVKIPLSYLTGLPGVSSPTPITVSPVNGLLTIDASTASTFRTTFTTNTLIQAPINGRDGQSIEIEISQDSTGSRLGSLDANIKFSDDAPSSLFVLSTIGLRTDLLRLKYNASKGVWYAIALIRGF